MSDDTGDVRWWGPKYGYCWTPAGMTLHGPASFGGGTFFPECEARGCVIGILSDPQGDFVVYQHGPNPEHRISLARSAGYFVPGGSLDRMMAWTKQIHAYEEGRWTPQDEEVRATVAPPIRAE